MPLKLIREDILRLQCDAVVNPSNEELIPGGGLDWRIHKAAGGELAEECRKLGGCRPGKAIITDAHGLKCRFIIHTASPVYRDGRHGEEKILRSCYSSSLALAEKKSLHSLAFPLIGSGSNGWPKAEALRIAVDEINSFLLSSDMEVYLVLYDKSAAELGEKLYADIKSYIDDNYVEAHRLPCEDYGSICTESSSEAECSMRPGGDARFSARPGRYEPPAPRRQEQKRIQSDELPCVDFEDSILASPAAYAEKDFGSLDRALRDIDESFSQMLLRKIDEKGMTDAQCYKKAGVDRKLFSKIRSDIHYRPSKPTAIAFAIALELGPEETEDMLRKAGYALSHSNKFDIIIEFCINRGIYDLFEINEMLYRFDQNLLGA